MNYLILFCFNMSCLGVLIRQRYITSHSPNKSPCTFSPHSHKDCPENKLKTNMAMVDYCFPKIFYDRKQLITQAFPSPIVQFSGSKSDKQPVLAQCISISVTTSNIHRLPASEGLQENNTQLNILSPNSIHQILNDNTYIPE